MKRSLKPIAALCLIKDYRHKQTPDTKHAIKIRIWYDGKRDYLDTHFRFTETIWEDEINDLKPLKEWREYKKKVFATLTKAEQVIEQLEESGKEFTFQLFENTYNGNVAHENELWSLFEAKIKELGREQWKSPSSITMPI